MITMIKEQYKYSDLTSKIIGCAMTVHKALGNGFQEVMTKLEDVHLAQAINYLEAYNLEIGLLINFGETSLNFKRLTNKKYRANES
jgi:hypothetical protein